MPGSPAMYFRTQRMPAESVKGGAGLGAKVLMDCGVEVYSRQDTYAAGRTANSHVAITCLPAPQGFQAVIMAAGDEAQDVVGRVAERLSKSVLID